MLLYTHTLVAEDTCPANGGAGCNHLDALKDSDYKCVRWRQTGGCNPHGHREKHGDKSCHEEVPPGNSGYCQCGAGHQRVRAREATCDHRPIICETECLQFRRYMCISWRQTGGCSAEGTREPEKDQNCDAEISPRMSGFCECGGGRIVRKPGCDHGEFADPFKCKDVCAAEPDLYEELGLDSSAPEKVIKQAFRKLSLKYHPDKTRNDPVQTARFAAIREAYEIISDAEQRAVYDAAGLQMVYESRNQKVQKGPSMNGQVDVDLEKLYNGAEITTHINRKIICRGCADRYTDRCRLCQTQCANEVEVRNVQMGPMIMQQQVEVPSRQKCRMESTKLLLDIEPGMSNGDTLQFKSMGEHRPKMIPGDVVMTIKASQHGFFTRAGLDLHAQLDISLKEALLGFQRSFRHLDGRNIEIGFDGITVPFSVMKIENEGMPQRADPTTRGSLYVKFRIVMPKSDQLGEAQRDWLRHNFPA